jgi:2,5-diketo-D-gluconate reductase A
MISLREEGLARSIGVSNFHVHHLDRLAIATGVTPVVNRVECHPWLPQNELRAVHAQRRIVTQAWSPLARGRMLADPTIRGISERLGVSAAQLILAWHLHRGLSVIPKSNRVQRLAENAAAVDLSLDAEVMAAIDSLETGERTGADPDDRD